MAFPNCYGCIHFHITHSRNRRGRAVPSISRATAALAVFNVTGKHCPYFEAKAGARPHPPARPPLSSLAMPASVRRMGSLTNRQVPAIDLAVRLNTINALGLRSPSCGVCIMIAEVSSPANRGRNAVTSPFSHQPSSPLPSEQVTLSGAACG